jgi:hypothetical protein
LGETVAQELVEKLYLGVLCTIRPIGPRTSCIRVSARPTARTPCLALTGDLRVAQARKPGNREKLKVYGQRLRELCPHLIVVGAKA